MAPKRPHDGGQVPADSGRARKKQKTAAARTINVQTDSSSGAGVVPATTNSMTGLPGAIDVEKFTEARAFEIAAMESAIETAKGASTQRAWQTLPRALRRRAASHDVRRVPVRLREKARAEMDPAKRKALGRKPPKRGKAKQVTRTQSFLKRQRDKTWLETHLWHAKRMHMKNLWGYRLAETPTQKSFRPSHRASVHGSILHDASYISTISISGKQSILEKMLLRCCDCQGAGPGAVRYTLGSRIHETHLYEVDAYPYGLIAPITIIWKPLPTACTPGASTAPPEPKKTRRRKGKAQEPAQQTTTKPDTDAQRTLWMRFHPSAWQGVWEAVQKAASLTLEQVRKDTGAEAEVGQDNAESTGQNNAASERQRQQQLQEDSIELVDLRSQVNCFEIMGPRATQVLLGALTPVEGDDRPIFKQFWSQLENLQTSGSVPRGMIIGTKVHDPRLNFPPKNAKTKIKTDGGIPSTSHAAAFTVYPNALLARSTLWDAVERPGGTLRPRFKKKDLDMRRRKNLVPGTRLTPLRQDDTIPLLLIQHTLAAPPPSSTTPAYPTWTQMHGWTLLLPPHWSMAFFTSLTYTGTRVGGLRERATQRLEAGLPDFPGDFPGVRAGAGTGTGTGTGAGAGAGMDAGAGAGAGAGEGGAAGAAETEKGEEEKRWERKPRGKRVRWECVGTRSPWRADWEVVLGFGGSSVEAGARVGAGAGLLPTQREPEPPSGDEANADAGAEAGGDGPHAMWLLRGADTPHIVASLLSACNSSGSSAAAATTLLHTHMSALRCNRGLAALPPTDAQSLLRGALVRVALDMDARGAPGELAAIYTPSAPSAPSVSDPGVEQEEQEDDGESGESGEAAGEGPGTLIGYVTTGSYSLSRGRGFAIGAVSLVGLMQANTGAGAGAGAGAEERGGGVSVSVSVSVKERTSRVCRAAHAHLLSA